VNQHVRFILLATLVVGCASSVEDTSRERSDDGSFPYATLEIGITQAMARAAAAARACGVIVRLKDRCDGCVTLEFRRSPSGNEEMSCYRRWVRGNPDPGREAGYIGNEHYIAPPRVCPGS